MIISGSLYNYFLDKVNLKSEEMTLTIVLTKFYNSYYWLFYCLLQILITGGMLLYVTYDVKKQYLNFPISTKLSSFHQPLILATEFLITMSLLFEIFVRLIVKRGKVCKEYTFTLDILVFGIFLGIFIYMCIK
jgi:hypothetical protein